MQGDHREGMEAYFNWMESLVPDFRTNAKNIFGMRGTHYSLMPTKDWGVETAFDHAGSVATGETWPHPYWLAAGAWCVRPFWDHYLVTGDLDFLRKRVVPAYKDLALFYEDFLTVTDKDGNYIFVPSFSPENNPGNLNPSCMMVINASMDIAGCREVLANLVEACELLGIEADSVPKWKAMLAKLPPYLLEPDGALKEWAWPTLAERYVQRHISHLYGAWPGDEIDPDRTPQLAKAVVIADRHRVPERLAAHGRCHRALVGARLKDSYMVDSELRQLIEEGYVGPTLRCSHDPYALPMPDAQGGIPTDHDGNAGLLAPRRDRGASGPSALAGERLDERDAAPHLCAAQQTGLGHGSPDGGPDGYLGEKAGRHFDCPAWHRSSFRLFRSFGGEAAARQGRLRPALAGRKAGGSSFETRPAQPVGLGQLGRLMLTRGRNYETQRFS